MILERVVHIFPLPPKTMLIFLLLWLHRPQLLYNIELGAGGSRKLTLDANKIEQMPVIKKVTSLFPSDFISVFVWHLTGKILSFEFYSKAVFFECKFRIWRSAIIHVQNWLIGLQRVGSRIRWRQRLTSLKLQRVNAARCTCKTQVQKKLETPVLHINLGIAFLN